ncbi:hypothetical protein [Curtobacterium sp. MCSS17_015]|uniref:hypothetical protein n=1 Tax=Curtobacterium sp. MCSS17_015 TaxID=2175666 RepID=UPI0011B5F397|nr:hypothetical protein [Curtobacterium sp. MCSS17_015]WIB26117.1 hypothetical protein DEJ18_13855 [Curtobacterium sp. MCSS17_015]
MSRPAELPVPDDGPFRVRDAVAAGATRTRLSRTDLEAPIHGVRAPSGLGVSRVEALALVLRDDQFFSHGTAALFWGAPVSGHFGGEAVHVTSVGVAPVMRRPHVVPHRVRDPTVDVRYRNGFRLSAPARSWYECAGSSSLEDLVVLGDYFLGPADLATLDGLRAAIPPRGRHVRRARAALARVRAGSESPMESRMRVRVVDAGFPEPEVNHDVFDASGTFLGRADMAWPDLRIALEYDGDHHREQQTFRHDRRRSNGFVVNDWIVVHATAVDADRPAVLFERLRQAFEQRRVERAAGPTRRFRDAPREY